MARASMSGLLKRCCGPCGGSNVVRAPGQRYCRPCHAANMRQNRPKHSEQSPEAQARNRARRLARGAARRGELPMTACPCRCGQLLLEMHHEDYAKPYEVVWACARYHQELDNRRVARLKAERNAAPTVAASPELALA